MTYLAKNSIFIGLGISGVFALGAATGVVGEKTPPTIAQCDRQAEYREANFRSEAGWDLSDKDRLAYLHINVMRRECINEAKAGPRISIAGL